jgi:hypothetical protein
VLTINKWLSKQGKSSTGLSLFRLVWSEDTTEIRRGIFEEHTAAGIYLRTVHDTREVPKYNYLKDRWILEVWTPPNEAILEELPTAKLGSYEPLYVFEDSLGNPLEVTLKVVEFIVNYAKRNFNARSPMLNRSLRMQDAEDQERRIHQMDLDSIDTNATLSLLHEGSGCGYGRKSRGRGK